jgi:hypothetical protein
MGQPQVAGELRASRSRRSGQVSAMPIKGRIPTMRFHGDGKAGEAKSSRRIEGHGWKGSARHYVSENKRVIDYDRAFFKNLSHRN